MEEKNEMGQYKDDFYNKLKNDYRLEGRNSFIYHYIKNEKEEQGKQTFPLYKKGGV